MEQDLIARSTVTVDASKAQVWEALLSPEAIKAYMFGATIRTDWQEGSTIVWKGEWKGKHFEDRGIVLQVEPEHTLQYSHYSPLSGRPDIPENYHTVTISLAGEGNRTRVTLEQDNNATTEARDESEKNWATMLDSLKKYLEQ